MYGMKKCGAAWFAGLLFIFAVSRLHGLPSVSGVKLGFDIKPEYNRSFYQCWTFALHGSVEFNNWLTASTGAALWTGKKASEIDCFIKGGAALPFAVPLHVELSYIFNGMPGYEMYTHSLLPVLAYKNKWAGISLGMNFRFTSFFRGRPIFEPMLAFSVFVNFMDTGKIRAGLECSNYDDFNAENEGAYYLSLNGNIAVAKGIAIINRLELYQSGSVGLSSTFYGIAFKAGVLFLW
jgi:hypothetical protein